MEYRNDTPKIDNNIRAYSNCFTLEAKVINRYLNHDNGMEELKLSGGAVMRRNKKDDNWRIWLDGSVGEIKSTTVEAMVI